MSVASIPRVCFIGFGEAGQAMAAGLRERGVSLIAAWDILFPASEGRVLRQAAEVLGVRLANSAADAVRDCDIVVSAVTASSSLDAAQSVAPYLGGHFLLDVNSVSPGRKQQTAKALAAPARYVDVAIMAPIYPARHRTPMLLAGPHAEEAMAILRGLDMSISIAGVQVGAAAAIKMVRSVMIKGIEALTAECFVAAARAGVVEQVVESLAKSYPLDWPKVVAYNLERMASHGTRRAV